MSARIYDDKTIEQYSNKKRINFRNTFSIDSREYEFIYRGGVPTAQLLTYIV